MVQIQNTANDACSEISLFFYLDDTFHSFRFSLSISPETGLSILILLFWSLSLLIPSNILVLLRIYRPSKFRPLFAMESVSPDPGAEFRPMLEAFMESFRENRDCLTDPDHDLNLPTFSSGRYLSLLIASRELFMAEPCLLSISGPVLVVGDLHGQIADLARVLLRFDLPDDRRYVFLGDLVDRGDFSLEVMTVCFLLKVIFPDNVFLIRGNHEFQTVCSQGGFLTQVIETFGNATVYQSALNAFAAMPLAGVIDGSVLCLHGGLSPQLTHLRQIQRIERPIYEFGDPLIDGLLWSDPSPTTDAFEPSLKRHVGFMFGERPTLAFLRDNRLAVIVRAHECVADGYEEVFGGKVITVFTASNYCGVTGNQGAVLEIASPSNIAKWQFPPLPWRLRKSTQGMTALPGRTMLPLIKKGTSPPRKANMWASTGLLAPKPSPSGMYHSPSVFLKPTVKKLTI
jgi:protein phosphatase